MSDKSYYDFSTEEVAKALCKLGDDMRMFSGCEEAIFHLKTIAENPHNSDFYRILWRVLQDIAYLHEDLIYSD